MSDLLVPAVLHRPNFFICSQFYGTGLRPFQCYEAADGLATGSYNIMYSTVGNHVPRQYVLPISLNFGEHSLALHRHNCEFILIMVVRQLLDFSRGIRIQHSSSVATPAK